MRKWKLKKKVRKMTINFHLLSITRVIPISNDDEEKSRRHFFYFFVALCAYFPHHHRCSIDEGWNELNDCKWKINNLQRPTILTSTFHRSLSISGEHFYVSWLHDSPSTITTTNCNPLSLFEFVILDSISLKMLLLWQHCS